MGRRKLWRLKDILIILIVVMVSHMYAYVKIIKLLLYICQFIICLLCINKAIKIKPEKRKIT